MKNKYDYNSGGYIAHRLMETKHAIKELLEHNGEKEISDYYKELFNCLDKAVEILEQ